MFLKYSNSKMIMIKMNKAFSFLVLSLMVILMLGAVSASTTVIAGKIYNSDYTAIIKGANVTVTCGGNVISTTSLADGSYKVQYTDVCVNGSSLTVYAVKGPLSGSKTGTIKAQGDCTNPTSDNCLINVFEGLDVAVVNVPLVPEFNVGVGALTALGAVGVFFLIRKK